MMQSQSLSLPYTAWLDAQARTSEVAWQPSVLNNCARIVAVGNNWQCEDISGGQVVNKTPDKPNGHHAHAHAAALA